MGLERFTDAQARIWPAPLEEIRAGRKTSHWMWFVFPQLRGLGRSPTAQLYGIDGIAEAHAYLAHPTLGPRLEEISAALLEHRGLTAGQILGSVDAMKLRSSMTLFRAAGGNGIFAQVLEAFYEDRPCPKTLEMIGGDPA